MKVKTSELNGASLDWAVAKCEGNEYEKRTHLLEQWEPSTDWEQGGPIIEREDITFRKYHKPDSPAHGKYYAMICRQSGAIIHWHKDSSQTGPTPLIAAMRAYVASKFGNFIEVPEELRHAS